MAEPAGRRQPEQTQGYNELGRGERHRLPTLLVPSTPFNELLHTPKATSKGFDCSEGAGGESPETTPELPSMRTSSPIVRRTSSNRRTLKPQASLPSFLPSFHDETILRPQTTGSISCTPSLKARARSASKDDQEETALLPTIERHLLGRRKAFNAETICGESSLLEFRARCEDAFRIALDLNSEADLRRRLRRATSESAGDAPLLALKALAEFLTRPGQSSLELANILLDSVILPNGEKAFLQESVEEAARRCQKNFVRGTQYNVVFVAINIIEILAKNANTSFDHVVGQILWRHRRAKVLQDPTHRAAMEEFSWAEADRSFSPGLKKVGHLERIFRMCAQGEQGGTMRLSRWRDIVCIIAKNPILAGRLKGGQTRMTEHMYAGIQQQHREIVGINCQEFKRLIVLLAENMNVHPSIVVLTVMSHAEHFAHRPELEKEGRLRFDPLAITSNISALWNDSFCNPAQ